MKMLCLFAACVFSMLVSAEECIQDLTVHDGVAPTSVSINDFFDLNDDGIKEKLVLLPGSMRAQHAIIYAGFSDNCYLPIYTGSDNVKLSETISNIGNISIKNNLLNGFKLITDSSPDMKSANIRTIYAYDPEQKTYRAVFSESYYYWPMQ